MTHNFYLFIKAGSDSFLRNDLGNTTTSIQETINDKAVLQNYL